MNPAADVNSCHQEMRTFVQISVINALVLGKKKRRDFSSISEIVLVVNAHIFCILCRWLVLIVQMMLFSHVYARQQMGWLMRKWIEEGGRERGGAGMSPVNDWWLDVIKTERKDWLQHGGRLGLGRTREGKAVTHIARAGCALHAQDALLSGRDGHGMNQGIHLAYAGFHGVFTRLSHILFAAWSKITSPFLCLSISESSFLPAVYLFSVVISPTHISCEVLHTDSHCFNSNLLGTAAYDRVGYSCSH